MRKNYSYCDKVQQMVIAADLTVLLVWLAIAESAFGLQRAYVYQTGIAWCLSILVVGGENPRLFFPRVRMVMSIMLAMCITVLIGVFTVGSRDQWLIDGGGQTLLVLACAGLTIRFVAAYFLRLPGLLLMPVNVPRKFRSLLQELANHPHTMVEDMARDETAAPYKNPFQIPLVISNLRMTGKEYQSVLQLAQQSEVADVCEVYEEITGKAAVVKENNQWVVTTPLQLRESCYGSLKALMDKVIVLAMAPLVLPIIAVAAIIIRLTSRGPAFFFQPRLGKDGEVFKVIKLRTMITEAEAQGRRWSTNSDSRVTPIGRILRASGIDELPQFWNVLCGQMSLIGPRPECPDIAERLEEDIPFYRGRLLVRPGLAGWAQLHQGGDVSLDDVFNKLCYDIYYIKHRSLIMDIRIFVRTFQMLLHSAKPKAGVNMAYQFPVIRPEPSLSMRSVAHAEKMRPA